MILPKSITIYDLIAYINEKAATREGKMNRYTFVGAEYFKRMKVIGSYTTDIKEIETRLEKLNLDEVFNIKLI